MNKANSDMWGVAADGCGIYTVVTKDLPAYADCLSGDRTGRSGRELELAHLRGRDA